MAHESTISGCQAKAQGAKSWKTLGEIAAILGCFNQAE